MILKRNKLTFQCKYNRDDGICQIFPIKKKKKLQLKRLKNLQTFQTPFCQRISKI